MLDMFNKTLTFIHSCTFREHYFDNVNVQNYAAVLMADGQLCMVLPVMLFLHLLLHSKLGSSCMNLWEYREIHADN